jgi:ParB family transcriptional regulator, chromosome partitioning protein
MTDITNIPLNKLTAWEGNVRKTQNKGFIDELAASIKAHGLQQNLIVRKHGRKFAVVAGGQRLKALQQLADAGSIESCHPVACKIIAGDSDATELSLAENVVRDNMHPADQFEAFRALIDKGTPVADIAARFGITTTVVTQRLKLARVSPVILRAYRDADLNLEQVMAFAISDDHAAQEHVLEHLRPHGTDPRTIRDALTEGDIAATDKRVKFVTLKAYEKAGGATRRDLFSQDDDGIFILDTPLLDKLAIGKLEKAAKPVRSEGWKWVEVRTDFGYEEGSQFHRRPPELSPLSPADAARLEALEQEYETLIDLWQDGDDDDPRPGRLDEIEEAVDKLNDRDDVWPPETLAIAGAIVTIGHDGKASVDRGLVRPEDLPKKTGKSKSSSRDERETVGSNGDQSLSAALTENLTAHKSAALSAALLQRPDIALAAVVHAFASRIVIGHSIDSSLQIAAAPQSLHRVESSNAFAQLEAARETWSQRIPAAAEALWNWCLEQDQRVLLDLLAFCTATTVNAVQVRSDRQDSGRFQHAEMLAAALALDMKAWFTPTAENYFSRISKPQTLEALREANGQPPAPAWEKLKKADLATVAESEISGTGWLPSPLR